jgi:hypothetical protein
MTSAFNKLHLRMDKVDLCTNGSVTSWKVYVSAKVITFSSKSAGDWGDI